MTEMETVRVASDDYDAAHAGAHASPLMRRLWSEAMGDQYPAEVEPFSSCSWWLLGHVVAALRLRPGGRLVDLGCGRGGAGLWLARALCVHLVGIDFSAVAVELARQRAGEFVSPERAEFRQGTFAQTGLPDECADGVVSVDALPFANDRVAALREARRIVVPGGRVVLTARERPADTDDWPSMAAAADLDLEESLVNPYADDFWPRLYALWEAHEAELRSEVGERATDNLLREARTARPGQDGHRALLLVLRRPEDR
ncbi:class I SAM-dependent methyltransferase [Planosporangium sp. 12N6]|uniref:class I SAM-dependent methyltransferase n=1 Tax=Planosporangium spinosum TaxID=3402278 RepID=UPI003CFAC45C